MLGKNFYEKFSVFVATWGYSGFIPPIFLKGMAGTYGSFFSIPLCVLALYIVKPDIITDLSYIRSLSVYFCFLVGVYSLGDFSVEIAEKVIGPRQDWKGNIKNHDQNQIVIDETLGMAITYCSIIFIRVELFSWSAVFLYFLGFLYFRLFDIIKIWPTKVFDRMENVFGVMMDDAVAGIYAALALYLSSRLFI